MILESGSVVLVFHRRLFDQLNDRIGGTLFKKTDLRTKIVSLAAGTLIVYQLPIGTDLANLKFQNVGGKLILSDRGELKMDLSEIAAAPTRRL
jgi:hypothetical protein